MLFGPKPNKGFTNVICRWSEKDDELLKSKQNRKFLSKYVADAMSSPSGGGGGGRSGRPVGRPPGPPRKPSSAAGNRYLLLPKLNFNG